MKSSETERSGMGMDMTTSGPSEAPVSGVHVPPGPRWPVPETVPPIPVSRYSSSP